VSRSGSSVTPRRDFVADGLIADGLIAGAVAAVVSGAPSTVHALATGRDPLEATRAAGTLLLPRETRSLPLLMAAVPVHAALSLGWGLVLAAGLPRRCTVAAGALGGLAIAALDLGVIGGRFPRLRALPQWPQVADHLAYGAAVGAVVARRRAPRARDRRPRRRRCGRFG
jgi:hypothetical protein